MFKVGDKVKIVKPFETDEEAGLYFVNGMIPYIGEAGKIHYISDKRIYVRVDKDGQDNYWLAECLSPVGQLRDAKGRFIKAPIVAPNGVVAEPAIMPVAEPVKALAEPPVKKEKPPYDLRAELTRRAGTGTCNYALEFTKTPPRLQANDACHARLLWKSWDGECIKDNEIKNIAIVVKPHYNKFKYEKAVIKSEAYPRFVKYILNDSPFAGCFVTKDVDEALTKGILMNINENVNHLVPAAMSLRRANECSSTLEWFGKVLDMGYSGDVAFLVSGFAHNGSINDWPGHSSFHGKLDYEEVIKFFKHGFPEKLKPMYNDQTQTRYQVWKSMCPTEICTVPAKKHISDFAQRHSVSTVKGEGFARRTEFDMEASVKKLADAFTELLEKA